MVGNWLACKHKTRGKGVVKKSFKVLAPVESETKSDLGFMLSGGEMLRM
jgi:hypothetical protein